SMFTVTYYIVSCLVFFFSSRRRHTRSKRDWSSDVCASDHETLLHSQGVGPDAPTRGRGHADGGQGPSGAEHGQTCGGRDGFQVGQSGASGVKPGRVEHGTGNEGGTVVTGQRQAIAQRGARGRAVDPEHGPHSCRLARAVRPQKPSDDAIGNRERDVVDRRDPTIALGQMLDLDHAQPSLFDSASPAAANIRSSSGRMAITTPATTSIPNASPERTSWA